MNALTATGKKKKKNVSRRQMCTLVCQKTEKNNVHIFDIMGTANLSEIFTARQHSRSLVERR